MAISDGPMNGIGFGRNVRFTARKALRVAIKAPSIPANAALRAAADASFRALTAATAAATPAGAGASQPDLETLANAMAAWSLVHGFTSLMIDGRLPDMVPQDALLEAVQARLVLRG